MIGLNLAPGNLIVNSVMDGDDDDEVSFLDHSENYCVCYIEVKVISEINKSNKIAQFYSIFLNSISIIIHKFAGKIMKNTGDGMIYYFP